MFVQHNLQMYISLIYGWVCRFQYKNRDIRTLPLSFQRMFSFFLVFFLHYKSNLKSKIDLKMLESLKNSSSLKLRKYIKDVNTGPIDPLPKSSNYYKNEFIFFFNGF